MASRLRKRTSDSIDESFLVFGAPKIGEEEIAEVEACLRSGWLDTGPRMARLEKDFAACRHVQASQVAAVNSCTAALHVSMVAAPLEPGAEVITTPLTFCATGNAILHAGLSPVMADVDPRVRGGSKTLAPRPSLLLLGACRTLAVEAKMRPCEDRFLAIRRPIVVLWAKSRRKDGPYGRICSPAS